MENEEAESRSKPARRGPWPLIALVIVATVVGIYLIPGEEQETPADSYKPRIIPVAPEQTNNAPNAPSLLGKAPQTSPVGVRGAQSAAPAASEAPAPGGVPGNPAAEPAAPATASAEPVQTAAAPAPVGAAPVVPPAPGAAARELIAELRRSSPADTARALAEARLAVERGEKADAYLLYFFAAREGDPEAALEFARQADPAHHTEASVFERPRPDQAYKWYRAALDGGNTDAAEPLATLKQHLEQAAAGGDDQARRLTLLWQ